MAQLWCDRRGVLSIGNKAPNGRLVLASGTNRTKLREAVGALGRLAYDGTTWLVPGIPEALTDEEAVDAASAFADRVHHHLWGRRRARAEGR